MLPFTLTMSPGPKGTLFRSKEETDLAAGSMGINAGQPTVTYCNSGHVSAAAWFALSEVAGWKDVALYERSMHAWTRDPARPVTPPGQR